MIDRQAAIDLTWKDPSYSDPLNVLTEVRDGIKALPSAQPELAQDLPNACTDAISRQAAIDALTEYGNGRTVYIGVEEAIRRIEQLPSAQPEQRWIPCSERLPETSGTYLVSGMWESGRVAVGDCEYTSYDGYFNTAWNFDVLAWMLLPEPYQESEQDENR